jgi:multicomponent Na+:H+ antiporter subunit D
MNFGDNALARMILLPLLTACGLILLRDRPRYSRALSLLGASLGSLQAFALARRALGGEVIVLAVGNWHAPLGITLAVDGLSAVMLAACWGLGLAGLLHETLTTNARTLPMISPWRLPLLHFLLMGLSFSFCTGDLFNLFVAFELTLVASYALLGAEAARPQRPLYPYLLLNVLGSTIFLCAAGFAYTLFGSLNFADMSLRGAELATDAAFQARVSILAALLLVAFGLKAGMIPFHAWLPNAYPSLPPVIAALFAGWLTKLGVYSLLRLFGTVLPPEVAGVQSLLVGLGALTLILGGLGALARKNWRAILSFHIVSQVGYMLIGLGLATEASRRGALAFLLHNLLVKSALFLVADAVLADFGSDDLVRTGGRWRARPLASLIFGLLACALSGVPPLTGFWSKWLLLQAAQAEGNAGLVAVLLLGGLLTLLSMLKLWFATFWGALPEDAPAPRHQRRYQVVPLLLTILAVAIGLQGRAFVRITQAAAQTLDDRVHYAAAVFAHGAKGAGKEDAR